MLLAGPRRCVRSASIDGWGSAYSLTTNSRGPAVGVRVDGDALEGLAGRRRVDTRLVEQRRRKVHQADQVREFALAAEAPAVEHEWDVDQLS